MRKSALIAAAVGGLICSSSFAAFTFTFTKSTVSTTNGSLDAVLVRAINDGVGTGTKVAALDIDIQLTNNAKAYFLVNDTDFDGVNDQVSIANGASNNNFGFVRLGSADDTFIVSANPTKNSVTPNPYDGGINHFAVSLTSLNQPAGTGAGALIARLLITPGAGFRITGNIGGDAGVTQPILPPAGDYNFGVTPPETITITPAIVTVDVSPPGLEGFAASTVVHVGASALTVGAIPAQIADNVTITGTGDTRVITGTGFNYTDIGTYSIVFTAGAVSQTFTLNVVPEPASLSLIGLAGMGLIRRRK